MNRSPFYLSEILSPAPVLDHAGTDEFRPEPLLEFARTSRPRRPRVVVTGISALAPNGNTAEEFWANSVAGKSGIAPVTHFDPSKFNTHFAAEVKGFDAARFMNFKEARRMSRCSQFAIACA